MTYTSGTVKFGNMKEIDLMEEKKCFFIIQMKILLNSKKLYKDLAEKEQKLKDVKEEDWKDED